MRESSTDYIGASHRLRMEEESRSSNERMCRTDLQKCCEIRDGTPVN